MAKSRNICPECKTPITRWQVQRRLDRGFNFINCPVCGEEMSISNDIPDNEFTAAEKESPIIKYTGLSGDDRKQASILWQDKVKKGEYDILFIYNKENKSDVTELKKIGRSLKIRGVRPWLDEWETPSGVSWQRKFAEDKRNIKSAVVFVGNNKAPWEDNDLDQIIRYFIKLGYAVVPAILKSCQNPPKFPAILYGISLVDFRDLNADPVDSLIKAASSKGNIIKKGRQDMPATLIRQSIGDKSLNQFHNLSLAVFQLLSIKNYKPIYIEYFKRNEL